MYNIRFFFICLIFYSFVQSREVVNWTVSAAKLQLLCWKYLDYHYENVCELTSDHLHCQCFLTHTWYNSECLPAVHCLLWPSFLSSLLNLACSVTHFWPVGMIDWILLPKLQIGIWPRGIHTCSPCCWFGRSNVCWAGLATLLSGCTYEDVVWEFRVVLELSINLHAFRFPI